MYFVSPDGQILDDGRGLETAPAYALSPEGQRLELGQEEAESLTARFYAEHKSRMPIGFGIEACQPCKRRQAALNRFGDRVARPFWR
jgi:hypothetical protein